ncbi:D-aminoacyl-tRNA deacylase [Rubinisphaera brasiliensis]|uniref:D-aminoacyl-tRNA deacylase n=1 Tax=Rubinisphaera brasiliensis (strain ATCC 49424 / DSM 5305 / JCM 21570 / IAM 15109 / NBRC 103401 / IFAM 1448) TaxID=756272 RepID=F0SL46_RUBBR|nr:D-aminoacyl-tRNA deacylase [Rubinisphaera brasiliensis]ADY60929.1 D-tyrosyl-tRNA(Tyr) deacylase [Rubinisphaera brasiliensis DSM 5305]
MRAVVQRVSSASVTVEEQIVGEIGPGLLILLGVGTDDERADGIWLAEKVAGLRIFPDTDGKMNCSVRDAGGAALVVSQFTLYGDCRKGKRPSFVRAAPPEIANSLYEDFMAELRGHGLQVESGRFQAHMDVKSVNDGPITLLLDSRKTF